MEPRFDCNCDAVIGMEELGVGTEEILQYAAALLPRRELARLVRQLEILLDESPEEELAAEEASESPTALSELAT